MTDIDSVVAYLDYLDDLHESGETNTLGAVPYLRGTFPELTRERAKKILLHWMQFSKPQNESKGAQ